MKNILTIVLLAMVFQASYGQDIINTKDKKQLNVRVIEKTIKVVKYKMADYEDGPVLWLKTNRISRIEYKNGFVDQLGNQNPRKNRPIAINAAYSAEFTGGGGMFSGTVDYFVMPQIDLEMNFGASDFSGGSYFAAGSRFHLNSNYSEKKLTPFTGLLFGSYYGDGFMQLPAGINYITRTGLNISLSVNQLISFNSWQATFAELRMGWRFRL
jgi:hypothetical protein